MNTDLIEEKLPWVTPWFLNPYSVDIHLDDRERDVLNELSSRWASTEKIALFNELSERYGRDLVGQVIDRVVAAHIQPEWEENGKKQPSQELDEFIKLMWEPLPTMGFEVEIDKRVDGVQIQCTRCPLADAGIKSDAAFWFYHLVCSGDPHAAAGFNPLIGFRRTQTLMEGHPCCDHFYFLEESRD
jgi:predicted ArsR family transcriptional regulator